MDSGFDAKTLELRDDLFDSVGHFPDGPGDPPLAHAYASIRTLRFADGPDEVCNNAPARAGFRWRPSTHHAS